MTPMRANIVGAPDVATRINASIAACHSAVVCSDFGSLVMYLPASSSVTSHLPPGNGIGSSNDRFQLRLATRAPGLWPLVPIKVRPDIGAPLAACLTDEQRFKIGQPNMVRPSIRAEAYRVSALIVGAVNQEAANA